MFDANIIRISGFVITLAGGGASGAPAVIQPFNPDSDAFLHEDDEEVLQCH